MCENPKHKQRQG
ncbi:MAG: 50S ribosomal protein L36 [Deltaproteobacteria bacterium]|nr:50S ribosomal protein L36 [Deltaproteobacteria bacterium]